MMHPDVDEEVTSEDELLAYLTSGLTTGERRDALLFVEKLLTSGFAGNALSRIWVDAGAEWHFRNNKAGTAFFTRLRDELLKTSG